MLCRHVQPNTAAPAKVPMAARSRNRDFLVAAIPPRPGETSWRSIKSARAATAATPQVSASRLSSVPLHEVGECWSARSGRCSGAATEASSPRAGVSASRPGPRRWPPTPESVGPAEGADPAHVGHPVEALPADGRAPAFGAHGTPPLVPAERGQNGLPGASPDFFPAAGQDMIAPGRCRSGASMKIQEISCQGGGSAGRFPSVWSPFSVAQGTSGQGVMCCPECAFPHVDRVPPVP